MTDQPTYTPFPDYNQEDIEALVSFIQARVRPLRDAARYDSEDFKAFQALLDVTVHLKGAAQSELNRGDSPSLEFHHLALVARQWDDHADFLPAWKPYG